MRSLILTTMIGLVANLASAEVPPEQAALIDKVVSRFKENDSRLGAVKARMKMVFERSPDFRPVQPPPPVVSPPRQPGGPVDSRSVLILHGPPKSIEWTAEVFGEIQRFNIAQWFGKEIISADAKGVTVYRPEENQAWIMPWTDRGIRANLQYDPRDFGFRTLDENLLRLHRLGKIESAKKFDRAGQKTIVELRAKSLMEGNSVVIECSSRFGLLPTRVYYVLDDGRVNSVADLTYQQVRVDSTPAWFLKSAVKRNAVVHNNKSPDDKEWGQVIRTTVTDVELDKLPPPRDDELSLPQGTSIQRRL
ncbi:MAG TPA: hypothetical protein VJ809_16230 [Pirellulales bacterium]|nr:hypothetical protein [Pirellulales bacterium]